MDGTRIRRLRPLWSLAAAALLLAPVSWLVSKPPNARAAQELVTPPPRPRDAARFMEQERDLLSVPRKRSVVLARATAVTRQPESEYERVRQNQPGLDLDLVMYVVGAEFQVVERLWGGPTPGTLEVDNRALLAQLKDLRPGSGRPMPITAVVRPGEYWILVWDPTARRVVDDYGYGTTWLVGPDDPLLGIYRRYAAWVGGPGDKQAFASMRAVVLDRSAGVQVRYAAFGAMVMRSGGPGPLQGARWPIARHVLVELTRQPDVPRVLHTRAIGIMRVEVDREPAPGSDDAALLRYLIRLVHSAADPDVVEAAAHSLVYAEQQCSYVRGRTEHYHFPQIVQALEARQRQDQAKGIQSPVDNALGNLKASGLCPLERAAHATDVIRHIPAR